MNLSIGNTVFSRRGLYLVQVASAVLVLAGTFQNVLGIPGAYTPVLMINASVYFLFLFGLSIVTAFKHGSTISLPVFLTMIVCVGGGVSIAIAYPFAMAKVPHFSQLGVVGIIITHVIISTINLFEKKHVSITVEKNDKVMLLIFAVFFLVRILMNNEQILYLDDSLYSGSIDFFLRDDPQMVVQTYSPYYDRILDWYYPWGFPILIALPLKGAGIQLVFENLIAAKAYMILLNSFMIFPVYLCMSKFLKNTFSIVTLTVMICFNQWIFQGAPYLLFDATYIMFFAASVYFFLLVLDKDGNPNENAILSILCGSIASFIRPNGLMQFFVNMLVFATFLAFKLVQDKKVPWLSSISWIRDTDTSAFKSVGKWFFVQGAFFVVFFVIFQLNYLVKNGVSIFDFATKYREYAYFNEGNNGQFTPVDGFTIPWLIERLAINLPFFITNFTQMTGFIHPFLGPPGFKAMLNLGLSLFLFIFGTIANVYFWVKHFKRKPLLVVFHFAYLVGNFMPIILWGETYYTLYRMSLSLLVLFIPPMVEFLNDLLGAKKHWTSRWFTRDRVSKLVFSCIAFTTLYGAMTFIIPLLANPGGFHFWDFTAWLFFDIPPF